MSVFVNHKFHPDLKAEAVQVAADRIALDVLLPLLPKDSGARLERVATIDGKPFKVGLVRAADGSVDITADPATTNEEKAVSAPKPEVLAAVAAEHQRLRDLQASYERYCRMYAQDGYEANDYSGDGSYEDLLLVAVREEWSRENLEGVILGIAAGHGLYPVGA